MRASRVLLEEPVPRELQLQAFQWGHLSLLHELSEDVCYVAHSLVLQTNLCVRMFNVILLLLRDFAVNCLFKNWFSQIHTVA